MTTRIPSARNASAMPRPIPDAPPVTTATFPSSWRTPPPFAAGSLARGRAGTPTFRGQTVPMTAPADLAALDRAKFISLTTFRRDGTPVPTPVWFAVDGTTLLVWTDATSGKAKRLRNDPKVEVAPSDARGRPTGAVRTGSARILDTDAEHRRGNDVINRKYGLQKKGIELGYEVARLVRRKPKGEDAVLEITLDP